MDGVSDGLTEGPGSAMSNTKKELETDGSNDSKKKEHPTYKGAVVISVGR